MSVKCKEDFFRDVACKDEAKLRITGVQNGNFILMAEYAGVTNILSKRDGSHMEYSKIEEIFRLIQIETFKTDIDLSIKNWVSK